MVSAPGELAVTMGDVDSKERSGPSGSIHIEFPGRAMISVERGADPSLLRSILESLRK
jgi:transposase